MPENWVFWLTVYVAFGTFIGGVVTPILTRHKPINEWAAMVLGLVVGALTNVVGLVVLWIILAQQKDSLDHRPPWQHDARTREEMEAMLDAAVPPLQRLTLASAALRRNWWPAARAEGRSHRRAYVAVFAALAVVTAIEVIISFADLGFSPVGPLVMLSTVKVALVGLFFMHLIYDSKWYALMFASAVPFSMLIVIVLALA